MESSNNYTSSIRDKAELQNELYVEQKKRTSAVLLQSGSDGKWWSDSME